MIVSFEVLFKTPVTANEGLAKLRDAVNNNERLGNFTVEALEIIQPVNPTTAASTEGSTGIPFVTRARKVISQLKMTCILGSFCNHDIDGNKNIKKAIGLTIIVKKTHLPQVNKKNLFTSFPTLHDYVKFPDAIFY